MARWFVLILTSVSFGCGTDESDGGTIPTWTLQETTRIGSQLDEGSALTGVVSVVATDSVIFVLERDRLARFDRTGAWLGDIGRQGAGPGEFTRPTAVGIRDAELWVADPSAGRAEVFDLSGTHVRSISFRLPPAESAGSVATPTALLLGDRVLAGPEALRLGTLATGRQTHRAHFVTTESGEVLRELYREELSPGDAFMAANPNGGWMTGAHPLRESPLLDARPDGRGIVAVERLSASGDSASFRLLIVDNEGRRLLDVQVPYVPIRAEGWLEAYRRQSEERAIAAGYDQDPAELRAILAALAPRDAYPPVSAMLAGTDGTIWLRREDTGAAELRWEVRDADGSVLGEFWAHRDLRLHSANRREVWGTLLDEWDVPFLVRFQVAHGSARPAH